MEIKGVRYTGPFLDNSGYGRACRGNILALHNAGVPITLNLISFENIRPDLGDGGDIIESLIDKQIDYNFNIIHTTPEFWERYTLPDKINVGYTVWETTKLHKDWPRYINSTVDKVLVPCEWNVEVFKDSGVTVPVGIVPHGISKKEYDGVEKFNISGIEDDDYVFYSIFQWCYDEKTRVLTKAGFKYFKDLGYDDEIATLNKETEELEYHRPEKIVKFRRKDKMFKLKGAGFDVCVTPDHKMVVRDIYDLDSDWRLLPLNEILAGGKELSVDKRYITTKTCKWTGIEDPHIEIHNHKKDNCNLVYPTKYFLELLGWYLIDGFISKNKDFKRVCIKHHGDKQYQKSISNCIKKLKLNPINEDGCVLFNSRHIFNYLNDLENYKGKRIDEDVKALSTDYLIILLRSIFRNSSSWERVSTDSKVLAEDILECLLKVGLSGSISKEKDGEYLVTVCNNNFLMNDAKLEEIDYDGYVYCATVRNHTMFVERNGKVLFSGNTERKHPLALIKAYYHAFSGVDDVALVLKTYRSDYSENEKKAVRTTLQRLKAVMPMDHYPKIVLISHMLSENEIAAVHRRGDCYVSLDRGEGWGLSPFQAGAAGNAIAVTGFGGSTEYAKPDNSYLVNYTLTPVFGMPWCLTENNYITTTEGIKSIKDLTEKDLVVNKNFNIKKINKIEERELREDEYILSIKTYSSIVPLEVTNNHKLHAIEYGKIVLKKASDLAINDYLYVPNPVPMDYEKPLDLAKYINNASWVEKNNRIFFTKNLNRSLGIRKEVLLNKKLAYLIGIYLAEGCVYGNSGCPSFSFNSDEYDTIVKKCKRYIVEVFDIEEKHLYERFYRDRNGYELIIKNKIIGSFFKDLFGKGSDHKYIPDFIKYNSSKEIIKSVLRGYWDGDGHVSFRHSKINPEFVATTKSVNLCNEIRSLFMMLGVLPSITKNVRPDGRASFIISTYSEVMDEVMEIHDTERKPTSNNFYRTDEGFAVKVKDISINYGLNGKEEFHDSSINLKSFGSLPMRTGIKDEILVNEELFYIIGTYLNIGSVDNKDNVVFHSLGSNEKAKELDDKIKEIFGSVNTDISFSDELDKTVWSVTIMDSYLGVFFNKLFGSANRKRINELFKFHHNKKYKLNLIKGYFDHGFFSKDKCFFGEIEFTNDIKDLLLTLNLVPEITEASDLENIYVTYIDLPSDDFESVIENANEVSEYKGKVYSVAVEPDEDEDQKIGGSYLLNGVASSNSPWYSGNGKQCWGEPDVCHGAETMLHIYNNREEAKEKGKKLRKYIYDNFSWEHISAKIIKELEEL